MFLGGIRIKATGGVHLPFSSGKTLARSPIRSGVPLRKESEFTPSPSKLCQFTFLIPFVSSGSFQTLDSKASLFQPDVERVGHPFSAFKVAQKSI